MTLNEALREFIKVASDNISLFEGKNIFYCGITNDIERRKKEHNVAQFLFTIECPDFETACELEKMLKDAGFDTGSKTGNGNNDSVYVYMYKKSSDTIE